ncbi:MAG: TldD/PmbA family protein [Candidatus Heimdallarchaeota archaeon]
MFDNAIDIGNKVIASSQKKGIEALEIFFEYVKNKQVMMNNVSISTQRAKEELGAGIRVIHKESEGFSSTNIITQKAIEKCVDEAFAIAKATPKIDGIGLPIKQNIKEIKGTFNQELADLSVEKITTDANDFINGFTSIDSRIKTLLSNASVTVQGNALVNSNEIELQGKSSYYSGSFMGIASDKDKAGSYTFDNAFSRKHDIDFLSIGQKIGKRAIDNLNQTTISSFDGPVIFRPDAMFNPILICIAFAISADWRQRGISSWKDSLGDTVSIESLNVVDKPHDLSAGSGIGSFDAEGNPTKEIEIVKDGVLQTFLHNQRTANKEKLESTGNAFRSMGGGQPSFTQPPANIFPNSPWVLPGDITEDEMIKDTKQGIIAHNFQGTVRYQNGIFSGVAKGAYLIEKGEITKPVTGISLSGNVFELLKNIQGIGKELHLTNAYAKTPMMKFNGIKVSTK